MTSTLAEVTGVPDRPSVDLANPLDHQVKAAIVALAEHPNVYQRGGEIVLAQEGRLHPLGADALRVVLAQAADFYTSCKEGHAPAQPPKPLAAAIRQYGDWPGIRVIHAIALVPPIRPDGTVHTQRGYDPQTRVLYSPAGEPIDVQPCRSAAEGATKADTLLDWASEFPMSQDCDRSALLALVLTLIGRETFDGPTPMFVATANTKGAGKSLMMKAAVLVGTGEPASMQPFVRGVEQRKTLLAVVRAAQSVCFFDNATGEISGEALDSFTTSTRLNGRILGGSTMGSWVYRTVVVVTGNNARYGGDTSRRVVPIRLERIKHPNGYAVPDLLGHLSQRREELWAAGAAILAGYLRAECPGGAKLPTFPTYEAWSRVIRGAVVWCGLPDPIETRAGVDADDEDAQAYEQVMALLCVLRPPGPSAQPWMVRAIDGEIEQMGKTANWSSVDAREALRAIDCWDAVLGGKVNNRELGKYLASIEKQRNAKGVYVARAGLDQKTKAVLWLLRCDEEPSS